MADQRKPKDVGSDSPGSSSAKEQRTSGTSAGPQASRESPRTPKQPRPTSNRRSAAHEHEGTVRKGYEAARNPERQGDGDPGPEQVVERSSQQGHAGRSHGSGGAGAPDRTGQSQHGSPSGALAREKRQNVQGDDSDPGQPA
ncbi:MAG TPA: hypothetical protein VFZ69_01390 [Longimicrobiales bacterium]